MWVLLGAVAGVIIVVGTIPAWLPGFAAHVNRTVAACEPLLPVHDSRPSYGHSYEEAAVSEPSSMRSMRTVRASEPVPLRAAVVMDGGGGTAPQLYSFI